MHSNAQKWSKAERKCFTVGFTVGFTAAAKINMRNEELKKTIGAQINIF